MKVKHTEIVDFLPKITDLPNGTHYGIYSCVTPEGVRFVRYEALREWEGETDTETGFTRRFMTTLPRALCRRSQRAGFDQTRPPLYVSPGPVRGASYVDIKAAFPSIYARLGWRVEYLRGKYMIKTEPLIWPYPESWKIGRSYVVTGARPNQAGLFVNNGRLVKKPYRSPFSNPSLVSAVYDVLGAFGRMAVQCFGAKYWNIDGGIMRTYAAERFIELVSEFGITARIKHSGDSFIFSAGLWYVGDHLTKRANTPGTRAIQIIGDRIPLDKKEAEWVLMNFRKSSYFC